MLYPALWAYRTTTKNSTSFTHFQLVYDMEEVLPIECEILSLKLEIELLPTTSAEEECFLYLACLDETHCDVALASEAQKKRVKAQYDQNIKPCSYVEGDLVLVYDQENDNLGVGKFEPMWHGPYIVKCALEKGAYEIIDYDKIPLGKPINGLYLKRYYA